jgi:outer membrane receptor protein involved in Fe transport
VKPGPFGFRQVRGWKRGGASVLGLALAMLLTVPVGAQQTGRILGRVTSSESGAPVSEAQVFLPGSGLGALSRQNGTYIILEVPAGTHELRVERIGLAPASQQVTVVAGQSAEANFTLTTQALGLDEIVVTGTAGAARRREVGNTISQLNVAEMPSKPQNVSNMLQGAAPGIEVSGLSGSLGSGSSIKLRGTHTVSMSNQPIIYIDGIRIQSKAFPQGSSAVQASSGSGGQVFANPLNNINPNDIERIEVIKGSAATTLYGTEASAGVIQVFTKRGSSGAPVWNLETQHSLSHAQIMGRGTPFKYHRIDPYLSWGYGGSYAASVRGGGQNLQYFSSGQYEAAEGILPSDTLTKYTVRGNFTFTPMQELQMQWNTAYAIQSSRNTPVGGNEAGITHNAYRGVANYVNSEDPVVLARLFDADVRLEIERFTTGGTVTYSPLSDLTNRLTIGYDHSTQETRNIRPFGFILFGPGSVSNDTWANRILTFDYVGTYSFDVMSNLRSSFSWGGQTLGEETRRINGYGETFPGAGNPTVSSAATRFAYEDRSKNWNAGFFFQNIFDISNRYFVTLGMRVDGNSAFGSGFGLQLYPKASASWVISDEGFWNEGWGSVKLRTAYGQSGRAPGAFDAVRTWASQGFGSTPALIPQNVGNEDLGPEVSAEFEAGLDGEWLDGRLSSTLTYYQQTTSDALFNVNQIPSSGFLGTRRQNVGKFTTSGIELGLDGSPFRSANWEWDLGLNLSTTSSEVVDMGGVPPFTVAGDLWMIEGQEAPVLRGRWIRNPDAIAAPLSSCTLAAAVADPSLPCIEVDHIFGSPQPTLTLAPSTSLRIPGGVTLSARGEFKGGHYVYENNFSRGGISRSAWMPICWDWYASPYDGPTENYTPVRPGVHTLNLKPDTPALFRAICTPALNQESFMITKGDFFRMRSVSASLPLDWAMPDRINNSMLILALNNLGTWVNSEFRVGDPEMKAGADSFTYGAQSLPPPTWSINASLRMQF